MIQVLILAEYIKKVFKNKEKKASKKIDLILEINEGSKIIVSLARLIQKMSPEKEVCCCIYIDAKNDVWYSTNLTGDNSYEELSRKIPIVSEYIINNDKLSFLQQAFEQENSVFNKMKRDQRKIWQKLKTNLNEKDKKILTSISDDFYKFAHNSPNWQLKTRRI